MCADDLDTDYSGALFAIERRLKTETKAEVIRELRQTAAHFRVMQEARLDEQRAKNHQTGQKEHPMNETKPKPTKLPAIREQSKPAKMTPDTLRRKRVDARLGGALYFGSYQIEATLKLRRD